MYRLATKCTTKIESKKHVRVTLLTVQPSDLILSSLVSGALHARRAQRPCRACNLP